MHSRRPRIPDVRRALAAGACTLALVATGVTPALAASVSVQAGGGTPDQAVQALLFLPGTITVDAGDSVTWADGSGEVHTISFGTPPQTQGPDVAPAGGSTYDGTGFVSSGILPPIPGQGYTLTFPKAGTFNYQCLIHPSMKGTVVVQAAGSPYPAGQASYKAASDPAFTVAISSGEAALNSQTVTSKANANGTTTYYQNAGVGDGKSYGVYRFGASSLTVHSGDTVVWTNKDPNNPHTVSFLMPGQDIPVEINGQLNPQALAPAGGTTYDGSGLRSSGFFFAGQSYSLTFTKPGSYQYQCLIHDEAGMKASITVLAASATAQVPAQLPPAAARPAAVAAHPATVPAQLPHTGSGGASSLPFLGLLLAGLVGIGAACRQLGRQRR